MTRRRICFLLAVVVLSLLGGATWYLWPRSMPAPEWVTDYDVAARPPETIPPGTVIGTSAPNGWSHLIIKSLPRIKPGQESKIPGIARTPTVENTRWMFTAFVADVKPETRGKETRYHLRTIALGLGTSVNGRDVVITPETAEAHGVKLDWITKQIITKGYETQRLAVIVVHGTTFGLLDTPVWFRCGESNRLVRYRYALIVDAATGRLDVLMWMLDPVGCTEPGRAVILDSSVVDLPELVPDPDQFDLLGIANEKTFGVDHLPAHRAEVPLPPDLRELASKTKFTPNEARSLENGLRELLASVPAR